MSFDSLMTDTVTLIKQDGSRTDGIKASVQKTKIFISGADYLIETGDLIQRKMSNGAEETYRVIDPGFHERFHGIPPGYQMDVVKLGIPEAQKYIQSITYNFNGHNARVNQNSIDNSTNVVGVPEDISSQLLALRTEIAKLSLSKEEKAEANDVIDEVEAQFKDGKPKRPIVKALLSSLPSVANIASAASQILSLIQ